MYALMTMLAAGIEAGAGAVSKRVGTARRRRTIDRAEPLTDAAKGALREVNGRAVTGSGGLVTAPLSGESCVWYSVRVVERYQAWRPGPLGPTKVVREAVAEQRTSGPLHVTADTVAVRVETQGADLDLGEPAFSEFEDTPSGPLSARLASLLGIRPRARHRDRTLGFLVEEYVITEDEPVYVAGQVGTDLGDLVITRTALRPLIVSRTSAATAGEPQG